MLPTMLGCVVQWNVPLLTALAGLEAPGESVPKSADPLSMTMRCATVSLFRKITCSEAATGTGLGTYEPLPIVPTIETVTVAGVGLLAPGLVGVGVDPPPPLQCDAATAAAMTATHII